MRSAMTMSRRKFLLVGGGIGSFLLATPRLLRLDSIWQDHERTLHSRLITLFGHRNSARAIGQIYLQRYPQDADVRALLNRVVADTVRLGTALDTSSSRISNGTSWLCSASDRDFREVLQDRIRQDFTEERVVKLHGWILSATEARLCALIALA